MRLLNFIKEKILLFKINRANSSGKALPPNLYQEMIDFEVRWLESHYDFHTIEGINAIPEKNPKRPPTTGITGEVYYYLRKTGYQLEESMNTELAIACLRKSVAILRESQSRYFSKDECYPLVKVLARSGYIDEAYHEKAKIDERIKRMAIADHAIIRHRTDASVASADTDLVIMDAHGTTCPVCAIYQGRVYSISGRSRKFPKAPDFYYTMGFPHEDCSHNFWAYIDGVNDPNLEYTLEVHPLKNKKYGKDIVTFSNRPFVDDRTESCKRAAAEEHQKEAERLAKQQYYEDHMIEIEAAKGQEARDYLWLQENIPTKCPKSLSGYRRMKTQNTKNYQALKQASAELGRDI